MMLTETIQYTDTTTLSELQSKAAIDNMESSMAALSIAKVVQVCYDGDVEI